MKWPVFVGLILHPVALVVIMLLSWQLAIADLGQEPVAYQHDPQFLADPIGQLNTVWWVLLATALPVFLAAVVTGAIQFRAAVQWSPARRILSFIPVVV